MSRVNLKTLKGVNFYFDVSSFASDLETIFIQLRKERMMLDLRLLALLLLFTTSSAQMINNDVFSEVEPLIASQDISTPLDAAPDNTGDNVYFIATGTNGIGVFHISMQGGSATEIKAGTPFVKLEGLALSSDSKLIFLADSDAQGGVIFRLSLEDNSITELAGTEGTIPKGLEVVGDQLYFTGTEDNQPAVFRLPVTGGERVIVAKGKPFENLSSIAATQEGMVYVSDRGLEADQGTIYRIDNAVVPIAQNLILGSPAGIALTADASVLAVSSLSADGHAQVVLINTATLETLLFNRVIGENIGAGGLHRSHGGSAEVFAWADTEGDDVYKVKPKKP